jgi:hypothetical protein
MDFDRAMKAYYKERDALRIGQRYRNELDAERPTDICECGDYRRDHPDNGSWQPERLRA